MNTEAASPTAAPAKKTGPGAKKAPKQRNLVPGTRKTNRIVYRDLRKVTLDLTFDYIEVYSFKDFKESKKETDKRLYRNVKLQ